MAIMKDKMMRFLRRTLLLCLCMALLAGSALANEVVDIGTEGYDCLCYECTLPDGRLLFSGDMGTVGNYADSRARLLCMNPDMTVSWEYVDPEEGDCRFWGAAVLEDGTIGALHDNSPYQNPVGKKLKFFTQEGEPTGKEFVFPNAEFMPHGVRTSGLRIWCIPEDAEGYDEFIDWNGNVILSYENRQSPMNVVDIMIEEEDGRVFGGRESGLRPCARIAKVDYQGNLLWETVLPLMLEGAEEGMLTDLVKADDGGYLGLLQETGPHDQNGYTEFCEYAVVKFSANGRLLWKNSTAFDGRTDLWIGCLTKYNGMLVTEIEQRRSTDYSMNVPHVFLWMDEEGNELGTTELVMKKEDLPRLADQKNVRQIGSFDLIVTKNGLWGAGTFEAENRNYMKEMDSMEEVLVKIPEL